MNSAEFRCKMQMAEGLTKTGDYLWENYCSGYRRGLRKLFYGENFGTEEEHIAWLSIPQDDDDIIRKMRGIGYRDGFSGKNPEIPEW